jgi:CMP-N,N'-diacetyllegionaminic acid synthase
LGEINFLKPKIIAIIPARSGSKSIKDKNIKILNGKPLIAWSIQTCLKSKFINRVVVSTDSKKYAKIAKKYGANEIIIRPKNISKDKSTDYEAILHMIHNLKYSSYDLIAHIRPTTPQRNVYDIDRAIKIFVISKYNSLRSVHEMSETAYKSFEIYKKNKLKPIANLKFSLDDLNKPRQAFKNTYVANGVIDIYKKEFILKNKKLFGNKVMAYITKYTEEVDSVEQFKYINYLLKKNNYK